MKKMVYALGLLYLFISIKSTAQFRKIEALDSGGLAIGYEAYIDFHYVYDFNRPSDRIRPFNSNPINVNQFGVAYTYGQIGVEYGRMTAKAAFHTGEIVSLMYSG